MENTFLLLLYITAFLLLLLSAASIGELIEHMQNRPAYTNAKVGCVLKPRKSFFKIFMESFK